MATPAATTTTTTTTADRPRRWQVFFLPTDDAQQAGGQVTAFCPFSGVLAHADNESEAATRWADEARRLWLTEVGSHHPASAEEGLSGSRLQADTRPSSLPEAEKHPAKQPPTHTPKQAAATTTTTTTSSSTTTTTSSSGRSAAEGGEFLLPTRLLSRKVWFGQHTEDRSPVYVIDFAFARDLVVAICPKQDRTLELPSEWRHAAADARSDVVDLVPEWVMDVPVRCTPIMTAADYFSPPPAVAQPHLASPGTYGNNDNSFHYTAPASASTSVHESAYHPMMVRHTGQGRVLFTSLTPHCLN
jgi:hypothetical protein